MPCTLRISRWLPRTYLCSSTICCLKQSFFLTEIFANVGLVEDDYVGRVHVSGIRRGTGRDTEAQSYAYKNGISPFGLIHTL